MTTPAEALALGCAAAAAGLAFPRVPQAARPVPPQPSRGGSPGLLRRARALCALASALLGLLWLPGAGGVVAAVLLGAGCWTLIGRSEPPAARREREAAAVELPHVVGLLATVLQAGGSAETALVEVCAALPGPATDRLALLRARLSWGAEPAPAWSQLSADPVLAPLGRALARAHESGAPVAAAVERLADDLARRRRADAEDRARTVGVRAAVPLGLCLLPSFVLLGVVPVVAGLMATVLG